MDMDLDLIMKFLDAGSSKEKLEILEKNRENIDDKTMTNIEVSLDVVAGSDNMENRIDYICDLLRTRARYETSRLRP